MKPKFKRFATEADQAKFVIVDAEKFPESRKLANVDNLPTFAAFKDGVLLKQVQTNKAEVLKEFVDEVTAKLNTLRSSFRTTMKTMYKKP